ncbi:4-hydroxy-tetrahydrodipicolinate reductase [Companilactobacillus baiquanensis]|uniref:4-hydroxy-tetrahydrodipicolinate reductase n=1 Tax=Companilactobacillus baiquanensis TaxID=2486005 RepID=A0ABW1UUF7_9LACO|nr:4-hydroxy-tetrahydrodipicolinate reductase [Companilactobacillus baiquanensis]
MIKVIVSGFNGSMGQKAVAMVNQNKDFQLVGVFNPIIDSVDPLDYGLEPDIKVYKDLSKIDIDADIWIDFSIPSAVFDNTKFAISKGIRPVIGTSGLSEEQTTELKLLADAKSLGGIIASNFGISAVLMMKFAQTAAKYFDQAEIVETHHEDKLDAPSGTALNTARLIHEVQQKDEPINPNESDPLGTRGGDYHGIKIHAIRLPGFIADEEVIFGSDGESLTVKQSTTDRASFMKGVQLAIKEVMKRDKLVIGLEKII